MGTEARAASTSVTKTRRPDAKRPTRTTGQSFVQLLVAVPGYAVRRSLPAGGGW